MSASDLCADINYSARQVLARWFFGPPGPFRWLCIDRPVSLQELCTTELRICSKRLISLTSVNPKVPAMSSSSSDKFRRSRLVSFVSQHNIYTSFCRKLLVYGAECIKFTPGYDNAVKSSWNYVFLENFSCLWLLGWWYVPVYWNFDYHVICASAVYQIQAKNVMFIKYVCPFLYDLFGVSELSELFS